VPIDSKGFAASDGRHITYYYTKLKQIKNKVTRKVALLIF
jgi:hypothetical protein